MWDWYRDFGGTHVILHAPDHVSVGGMMVGIVLIVMPSEDAQALKMDSTTPLSACTESAPQKRIRDRVTNGCILGSMRLKK